MIDREMKQILWHKNFCRVESPAGVFRVFTHDNQVTEEGNILAYVNSVEKIESKKNNSGNVEPLTLTSFGSNADESMVTKLRNGNYIYNDRSRGSEAFEITPEGEKLWSRSSPPVKVRPLLKQSFLKSRDLL